MKFLDINGVAKLKEYVDNKFVTAEEFSVIEGVERDTYTKQEIDTMLAEIEEGGADLTNYYTKTESDNRYATSSQIPTKTSQLTNNSGFITSETDPVFAASAAAGITSSDITNWNNKTSNTGTVTQVKVGTTAYNPSSGVVSLPAYPSAVTESTVSGWGFTKNAGTITGIKMNGSSKGTSGVIDLGTVLTSHQDISGKADKSAAISSLGLTLNPSDYKLTLSGTKADGTTFTVSDVIDLPLESVVVGGSYNNTTKKVVLTLQNGNTIDFSVADLVSGLQTQISSTNKLSADLISDGTTNKVVTATEKSTWNGKQDAISDLTTIRAGAAKGASLPNVSSSDSYKLLGINADGNIVAQYGFAAPGVTHTFNTLDVISLVEGFDYNDFSFIKPSDVNTTLQDALDAKQDTISDLATIRSNASAGAAKVSNVQSDWNATSGLAQILNKPTIPAAVTESTVSGWGFTKNAGTLTGVSFNGTNATVTNGVAAITATIPTVNNNTITIQKGGTTVDSFTTNASSAKTINIPNELPAYSASNNGQILGVVNGALTWITPTQIYSGSSAPNNSTGNNGDVYLQT